MKAPNESKPDDMVSRACRFLHMSWKEFFSEAVRLFGSSQDKFSGPEIHVERYRQTRTISEVAYAYLQYLKPGLIRTGFFAALPA